MSTRAQGIFVFGAAVLLYLTSLPGSFHYDDEASILRNPAVRGASYLPRYFTDPSTFSVGGPMVRPVLMVTYLQDYAVAEYRPRTWHSTNVLLHGLNAFLVVLLAARLLRLFGLEEKLRFAPVIAGAAFALHPVHSEVVNYVSARSCSLATAGFLGALLLHLSWTRGPRRAVPLAGSLLLFAFGLGSKETAVALVPAVFLLELLDRQGVRTALARTAPVLVLAIGYLALRQALLGSVAGDVGSRVFTHAGEADPFRGSGRTVFENLLTQSRVFWRYLGLIVWPVHLAVDHDVRVSTSLAEPAVVLSLLGIAALVVALCRSHRFVALCGALFLLGLAPTSSIVPLNVLMNEHRLYLPGVGVALLTGTGLAWCLARRPRVTLVAATALAAFHVSVVVPRNRTWQSGEELWRANLAVAPASYRARCELGKCYANRARGLEPGPEALALLDDAIAEFRESERLYGRWDPIHVNLGLAFKDRARITRDDADFEAAVRHFEAYERRRPGPSRAGFQIAMTYSLWGREAEAEAKLAQLKAR